MAISPRTAIVAGATGLIGSCLLHRLLREPGYDRIIALTRKPIPVSHPKLEVRTVTLDSMNQDVSELAADDWYCALGTTIKQAGSQAVFRRVDHEYPLLLGQQAAASHASQFHIVTALGASPSSKIFYSRVKGEIEKDLGLLHLPQLHIYRPSLLLGDRLEQRKGEGMAAVIMKGISPLLWGPLRKYRAIQADTVAKAMIAAAKKREGTGVKIYEGAKIEQLAKE